MEYRRRCQLCGFAFNEGDLTGSHRRCRKLVTTAVAESVSKVFAHGFEPTADDERRKAAWARSSLVDDLSRSFSRAQLESVVVLSRTSEVLRGIAEHLLPEFSVLSTEALLSPRADVILSLTGPVWARCVQFQGVQYVSGLGRKASDLGEGAFELFMPARNALANVVYIAENHLGVVKIVFADPSTWLEVGQVAGIWWKAIYIPCGNCPVVAQTDGIKLRALLPQQSCENCLEIEEQHDSFNGTAFPIPIHPQRLRWFRGPGPIPQRMGSFTCNGQASVGISTYSNAAWVFTPLDKGELIAEIWWATEVLGTDTALGFRTNKGREVFMGYPARLEHEEWTWRLIDQPKREEHQIFYESTSPDNVKTLAFESPEATMDGVNNFDPVRAINRLPDFLYCQDDFFYTSASLNSVVQITACRAPDTSAITGMILQYDNGHQEGLGEVRFDCLDTPIQVGGEGREKLWLRFQYDPSGIVDEHPRLVEMQFFPLGAVSDTETVAWYTCLELSWEGQLEWWWNPHQCQVFYGDKGSLEPRDADLWLEAAR